MPQPSARTLRPARGRCQAKCVLKRPSEVYQTIQVRADRELKAPPQLCYIGAVLMETL